MSRIGKQPITVPAGVEASVDGQDVRVKGPKGELSITISRPISVANWNCRRRSSIDHDRFVSK